MSIPLTFSDITNAEIHKRINGFSFYTGNLTLSPIPRTHTLAIKKKKNNE